MRALAIVHQADAGPGVFADVIEARGWRLTMWSPPMQPMPVNGNAYDAVLAFGGAINPDEDDTHSWLASERAFVADIVDRGVPTLGVCLGAELLAQAGGGGARRAAEPEIGWREITLTEAGRDDPLLGPQEAPFEAFQWHSYESVPPPGAAALAESSGALAAFRLGESAWGIQFHAEVALVDAARWIRDYRSDADAVRIGVDPDALLAETASKIRASKALGAGICERFIDLAERTSG
jgi:GMP synthase-like glutamine amidotransferase